MTSIRVQGKNQIKPSGIDWIGDIPNDWISRRGKFVFRSAKKINKGMKCENILSLTMRGVISRSELGEGGLLPSDYSTFQIFEKDDLVFKLIDLENYKTSRVGLVHEQGIMSSAYIRIFSKLGQDVSVRYFYYYYYNLYLEGIYNFLGMGVRSTMNDADLLEMGIVIPLKETQEKIVAFFDEKMEVVDAVIARKKRLIGLLKEKRSSIITHAVTRGLDPDTPTKPSGIDWIGDIPSGWNVKKLKYITKTVASNVDKIARADENEVRLCNYVNVYKNEFITKDIDFMASTASLNQIQNLSLREGDVLLTKDSETADDIGIPAYVSGAPLKHVVCGYHLYLSRPHSVLGKFLFRFLQSKPIAGRFEVVSNGVTRYGLSSYPLINTEILLPPKETQDKIVEFLDEKTKQIDDAIATIERQIGLFKEYRASLIYHCVTGKILI